MAAALTIIDPSLVALPDEHRALTGVRGRSGTQHSGGKVVRDWDVLTYRERAFQLSKMLLEGQVQLALGTRLAHVKAAVWEVRCPVDGDPLAEQAAQFVREVLGLQGEPGLMQRPFDAYMAEAAYCTHFGSWVQEVVWADHYTAEGTLWHIPLDLQSRIPASIERWGDADQLGPITQVTRGEGRPPEPMPGLKVLVYTKDRMGTDWTGNGCGRAAWSAWRRMCELVDVRQIGSQARGILPPVVSYDPTVLAAAGIEASVRDQILQNLRADLLNIQAGQPGVLTTVAGIGIDWGTSSNFDPAAITAAISAEIDEIHAAYGTGHLRMGLAGNTGNRSLGEVSTDTLRRSAVEDVEALAEAVNGAWRPGGGLLGAMMALNFPGLPPHMHPRLVATGLEPDALAEALGQLPALASGGVLTLGNADEDRVRGVLGLDLLPESDYRSPIERAASGGPGGAVLGAMARRAAERLSR